MQQQKSIEETVDEIIALYQNHGNEDYIGEPVSQIEHMCQCAQLAEENGEDEETILAAFFHDIGHLVEFEDPNAIVDHMDNFGIAEHEKLGRKFLLSKGFSVNVADMVASHVDAKRYLTYKYPEYYDALSEASKQTLVHQGGQMAAAEAKAFEDHPLSAKYIALRRWDEQAKEMNKPLPSLEIYRQMMIRHLTKQQN